MKFDFQFSNLFGTVYSKGNVLFTPDGKKLISPVGNRITVFDLVEQSAETLRMECLYDIRRIAISPSGTVLICADQGGWGVVMNLRRQVQLAVVNFKGKVRAMEFSPDGKHFAVAMDEQVQVWKAPRPVKEYHPMTLVRTYREHQNIVRGVQWSACSTVLVSCSDDLTAKVLMPFTPGYRAATLAGVTRSAMAAFFLGTSRIYVVDRNGALLGYEKRSSADPASSPIAVGERGYWHVLKAPAQKNDHGTMEIDDPESDPLQKFGFSSDPHKESTNYVAREGRYYFRKRNDTEGRSAHVRSAMVHASSGLLLVGFDQGLMALYQLPEVLEVMELSVSVSKVTAASISPDGQLVAVGCAAQGQLLVWDWQAESYLLKQQSQRLNMGCAAYSPDGQFLVSGADDGKVKLWNGGNGFCFVTFKDHRAPVTQVAFSPQGKSVFSASMDGTVRAYDLVRYRNFRTFSNPGTPAQFTCLALDPSGEIVAAGTHEPFEVHVWSVQTGKWLDALGGHSGPISAVAFSPTSNALATASWDQTVRIWDLYARGVQPETLQHASSVMALAWRPDGKHLAVSTVDGQIHVWDVAEASVIGTISGRLDLRGPKSHHDSRSARNATAGRAFSRLAYSADGHFLLAGGQSVYVCLYSMDTRHLLRRFALSQNRTLDGTIGHAVRGGIESEAGVSLRKLQAELRKPKKLGAVDAQGKELMQVAARDVAFSPTGRAWAAVSPEGLLVFAVDDSTQFAPFELEEDMVPESIDEALSRRDPLRAIVVAIHLNEPAGIEKAVGGVWAEDVPLVATSLPASYVRRLLQHLAAELPVSQDVHFRILWLRHLMFHHGNYIRDHTAAFRPVLQDLQRALATSVSALTSLAEDNRDMLNFLASLPSSNPQFSTPSDSSSSVALPLSTSNSLSKRVKIEVE